MTFLAITAKKSKKAEQYVGPLFEEMFKVLSLRYMMINYNMNGILYVDQKW